MEQVEETTEVTLESLQNEIRQLREQVDQLGGLLNWLCENMQGLFQFIQQMGQSGGGIRGLMSALKNGGPDLSNQPVNAEDKVQQ